jgi:hypothetical protein
MQPGLQHVAVVPVVPLYIVAKLCCYEAGAVRDEFALCLRGCVSHVWASCAPGRPPACRASTPAEQACLQRFHMHTVPPVKRVACVTKRLQSIAVHTAVSHPGLRSAYGSQHCTRDVLMLWLLVVVQ